MRGYWRRRSRGSDLEGALRANRPEPRSEFVKLLAARIDESRPRRAALRLAFAAALTLMMVAALLAFGGIGYAGSAAQQVGKIAQSFNPQSQRGEDPGEPGDDDDDDDDDGEDGEEPDDDQYQEERRQCRRAAREQHRAALREIRQAFQECKRAERARHRAALDACGNDRDCKQAEKDRHRAELRRCREVFQEQKEAERARFQAALASCRQIGR